VNASTFAPPAIPAADPTHTQWFIEEVQPHESALRAYLRVRFPSLTDCDDLVQESFARILRVRRGGTVRSPKALLFTTARNAALDLLRRERVVPMTSLANIEQLSVLDSSTGTVEIINRDQELQLLDEAVQSLPARCRQILILKKIDGLSYAEIGERLGIKPNTISAQLTLGVLRCRYFLAARGILGGHRHE
jgi:RNA polymerase sigma factor (sigma-70 family)